MYPAPFTYQKVDSVDEALSRLGEQNGREIEVVAGGHSLLPTMKSGLASPDELVDISGIEDLHGVDRDGSTIGIGALTSYATIANDQSLQEDIPVVAAAAQAIGDVQVRNRGTIGGNIAHADPASDLPAAVLAADATVHVEGPGGERDVPIDDFFMGMYETDIGPDELLTRIDIPVMNTGGVGVYLKKPSPSSGYAMVGVAVALDINDGTVTNARVAANGAVDHAIRLTGVEDSVEGSKINDVQDAAAYATDGIEEWEFMDDLHASAEFRAQLLEVYTERALEKATDNA